MPELQASPWQNQVEEHKVTVQSVQNTLPAKALWRGGLLVPFAAHPALNVIEFAAASTWAGALSEICAKLSVPALLNGPVHP